MIKRRIAALAIVLGVSTLLFVPVVYAVDNPDNLQITSAQVYRDLVETGDLLMLAEYNIEYATTPVDSADINFLTRLLQSNTTLGTNVPYPFNTEGYGQGAVSIYLSQTETEASGFTDSSGVYSAWPIAGLTVKLEGNPTVFTSPEDFVWGLTSGDYSSGEGQAVNQFQLSSEVLRIAARLQAAWGIDLLTSQNLLSDVPAARFMATQAFSVSTVPPSVPTDATASADGTFAVQSATRFDGTAWLTPAFDSAADDLGMPRGSIQGLLIFIFVLVLIYMGSRMEGTQGSLVGFGAATLIVLPVSMILGFTPWAFGALALAAALALAIIKVSRENFA